MKRSENWTRSEVMGYAALLVVWTVVSMLGCSTMERSVMLGAGSGMAAGAAGGLMFGGRNRTEATLISAGVGAVVGGLASYVIHGQLDRRDDRVRRDTLFNLENHGIARSSSVRADLSDVSGLLTMPEVEEDWVDTHTEGPRLIEGHRVFTITNGSQWDLSKKSNRKVAK